jgi:sensor histidine kinase YesM
MQIISHNHTLGAKIVNNRWIQHLLYWIAYVLFFSFAWGSYDAQYSKTISVELINLPLKMALVYSVIYWLYPQFLYKEKVWQFISYLIVIVGITAALQRVADNLIIVDYFFPEWQKAATFSLSQIVRSAVNFGSVLILPMTIKLMEYLNQIQQYKQTLAKEKLEAELAFLKNQVQPHFLFNTLNSLYSLILKQSDESLNVVLKLSELLRYMLYETNSKKVDLQKEISCVKSYLELEQIRHGNRIDLSLNVWGEIDHLQIAPMLILPFIENSFKHSTKGFNEQAWITIELGAKENSLVLKVENSLSTESADQTSLVGGIGLKNVKRRLSLLYPNNHTLKTELTEDSYSVYLNLELR